MGESSTKVAVFQQPAREGTREKGSVVWQAAMAHSTENIGTSECVMVLVERK
jgi:hypothetical protein